MTDNNINPNNSDLTLEQLNAAFHKVQQFYWEQIERLEQKVETIESISAMLTQGFAEVASSVEAVMTVMSNESPEKGEQLREALVTSKEKILQVLNPPEPNS